MIINLRSTNGGGKSTLVKALFGIYSAIPIYGILGPRKPEAYFFNIDGVDKSVYLLGPYQTPAGGADCIQPYENIPPLIEKYAKRGHVMFEGVLISKSKGTVGVCLEQWGKEAVLLFLDTPLEECIRSVKERRTTREDGREFNPKNLIEAYKAVERVKNTLIKEDKLRVMTISRENGLETILQLLKEAK